MTIVIVFKQIYQQQLAKNRKSSNVITCYQNREIRSERKTFLSLPTFLMLRLAIKKTTNSVECHCKTVLL